MIIKKASAVLMIPLIKPLIVITILLDNIKAS